MSLENIISEIDAEIARLVQAKELLGGVPSPKRGPGRPRVNVVASPAPAKPKRKKLSVAARARISAVQKARWAKVKKGNGKVAAAKSEPAK